MSYLKFDKNLLINLDQSLPKEILRTNKAGAYHCTTVTGCNTRKQHGLLVIPIKEMNDENHVLLSSLDETVIQHGAPFNLGIHRYKGGVYSPNGHKYLREFNCDTVPKLTYRVGGVILTKEKVFVAHENRILIKYTLLEAHSPTTLQFQPFLAFRNAASLCTENSQLNGSYEETENGVSFCLYPGYPRLYLQFNHKPEFVYEPHWYNGIEYIKDLAREEPFSEDLWVPGYFQLPIKKGESIIFSAGTEPAKPRSLSATFVKESQDRTPRTSFYNCLKNSAKQCYLKDGDKNYLLAGYPWFKILARDMLIALPGTTMAINHRDDFEKIMDTAVEALTKYLEDGTIDSTIKDIDLPDIPLWATWTIYQYFKFYGAADTIKKYGKTLELIINKVLDEKVGNLYINDRGMLSTNGTIKPVTWMDAVGTDGKPQLPRTGYIVEFNALWYNALMFACTLFEDEKENHSRYDEWQKTAALLKDAFVATFLNDHGYLYDYVDGNYMDLSVRPNMLIAAGLDFSPLDKSQRKRIIDIVTRELLTPNGIRTLSPKSYGYNPFFVGSARERVFSYFNGPTRPWLTGFYIDAYLRVFGMSGVAFLRRMLIGYEDDLTRECIGSLSELYDGNPPYNGHGAISFAPNIGEVLRALHTLNGFEI